MTVAIWTLGILAIVGGSAYGLRRYVRHREFEAEDRGVTVGKAIGRLTNEELFAIIHGCPMPPPREPKVRSRWWRR